MPTRKSPKISAILFDKDGTLIDYHRTWIPLNREAAMFAAGGQIALAENLLAAGGWDSATERVQAGSMLAAGSTTEIAELWHNNASPFGIHELTRGIDQIFARGMAAAVPVGDLRRQFADLKERNYALGIASSDSAASVAALVDRFELNDLVDFVAGYDSGYGSKPSPGMFLAFCAAIECQPGAAAVVGDNLHDMQMAESGGAGLKIAVLTGTGTVAELTPNSDACIASIKDLDRTLASFEGVE